MVRAAAESWFEQFPDCPLRQDCNEALTRCERWSSRRNDTAHGQVTFVPSSKPEWMLFPGFFTMKHSIKGEPKYVFRAEDINGYAEGFMTFWQEMNVLTKLLDTWHTANATKCDS
jgi:hypothetical protein